MMGIFDLKNSSIIVAIETPQWIIIYIADTVLPFQYFSFA